MLSKEEIEKAYWEGYIAKQNEAMEICKQCKYIKKVKQLESREQKLIEKLEERIRYFEENDELIATSNDNYSDGTVIKRFIDEFKEILEILKKE